MLSALAASLSLYDRAASSHRLQRREGLPGYLILFAPHAFVYFSRQYRARGLPRRRVFLQISKSFSPLHRSCLPPRTDSRLPVQDAVSQG